MNIFMYILSYQMCAIQSVTNIFKYLNIFYTKIYSDIQWYQFSWYEYIRIFVRIIFLIRIYTDIHSYQNHTLLECDEYLNIQIFLSFSTRIFIRIIFVSFLFIRIYSDIPLYLVLSLDESVLIIAGSKWGSCHQEKAF